MVDRVKDKVVLLTGAGAAGPGWGNGKSSAVLYAREGAEVFAVDVNADAVEDTKAIIEGEGGVCATHIADVTDGAAVGGLVATCIERFERIDILHNNVGVFERGGPEDLSEEAWDRLMAINLKSMFLTCKEVIPHMLRRGGGAIVNISSIASRFWIGYPNLSYCASKGAVNAFTRQIAMQYAGQGIRCNAILPGSLDTSVTRTASREVYGDEEELIRRRAAANPMGRIGDGWDVAYAALYLASDESKYVTGAELTLDGGATLVVT